MCCCLSWCFGEQPPEEGGTYYDVPCKNKLCVAFVGLLGGAISISVLYQHHLELQKWQDDPSFTCTYVNSLGGTVDVGKLFVYAMLVQFWVYLCLSICILITLLGAYYAGCRCFNAFVHTLGLFAHVFAIAYLGTTRFSRAGKLCAS